MAKVATDSLTLAAQKGLQRATYETRFLPQDTGCNDQHCCGAGFQPAADLQSASFRNLVLTMYLARIDGTMTTTVKHETLQSCRFLIGRRLDSDGVPADEPIVILDRLGARRGSTVIVSTDGDIARKWLGNTAPARLIVVGIVDEVHNGKRRR